MSVSLERESTKAVRFPVSFNYGGPDDLTDYLVAMNPADPDTRPGSWISADLIGPDDPNLGRGATELSVTVGPENGERPADLEHDGPGDYQLWVAIGTVDQWIVERAGGAGGQLMRLESKSVRPGEWVKVQYDGSSLRQHRIQIGELAPKSAFLDRAHGVQYLQTRCPSLRPAYYNVFVINGETLEMSRVGTIKVK